MIKIKIGKNGHDLLLWVVTFSTAKTFLIDNAGFKVNTFSSSPNNSQSGILCGINLIPPIKLKTNNINAFKEKRKQDKLVVYSYTL